MPSSFAQVKTSSLHTIGGSRWNLKFLTFLRVPLARKIALIQHPLFMESLRGFPSSKCFTEKRFLGPSRKNPFLAPPSFGSWGIDPDLQGSPKASMPLWTQGSMHWDVTLFAGDEGRWRAISKHPHGSREETFLLPSYYNEFLACLDRHSSAFG